MEPGDNIRRLRLAQRPRLTQAALAKRAGISDAAISYIETGQNNAAVATLRRIAKALGVTVADLFAEPSAPANRSRRRREKRAV